MGIGSVVVRLRLPAGAGPVGPGPSAPVVLEVSLLDSAGQPTAVQREKSTFLLVR